MVELDGLPDFVERHEGERIVGADLPDHQVGTGHRHLVLDPQCGVGGELARHAAIDDHDVGAFDHLLEDTLDLAREAALAPAGGIADR